MPPAALSDASPIAVCDCVISPNPMIQNAMMLTSSAYPDCINAFLVLSALTLPAPTNAKPSDMMKHR